MDDENNQRAPKDAPGTGGSAKAAGAPAAGAPAHPARDVPAIRVVDLTMAYGDFTIMRDLNFEIRRGEVFVVMGPSGCGKSTLLKHLIGLYQPAGGTIFHGETDFSHATDAERAALMRRIGVTYQGGALFTSMTLAENVAIPLERETDLDRAQIRDLVSYKLSLVGLRGYEEFYPSEISGGMRKRASLARAIALDPELLFFDEPSAGLDPASAARLDELILELKQSLGTTVVIVTHELDSIFAIGDTAIYLDTETRTLSAVGNPRELVENPPNERVRAFLTRGGTERTRDR